MRHRAGSSFRRARRDLGFVGAHGPGQLAVARAAEVVVQHAHAVGGQRRSTQPALAAPTWPGRNSAREHVAAAVDVGLAQRGSMPRARSSAYIEVQRHVAQALAAVSSERGPAPACTMWHMAPTVRRGSVSTTPRRSPAASRAVARVGAGHVARVQRVHTPRGRARGRPRPPCAAGSSRRPPCGTRRGQHLQRRLAGHAALGGADEEQAAGRSCVSTRSTTSILVGGVEVDQHVAQEDHVERADVLDRRHRFSWPKRTRSRSLSAASAPGLRTRPRRAGSGASAARAHVAQPVLGIDAALALRSTRSLMSVPRIDQSLPIGPAAAGRPAAWRCCRPRRRRTRRRSTREQAARACAAASSRSSSS
jgi:hypothetical protein